MWRRGPLSKQPLMQSRHDDLMMSLCWVCWPCILVPIVLHFGSYNAVFCTNRAVFWHDGGVMFAFWLVSGFNFLGISAASPAMRGFVFSC